MMFAMAAMCLAMTQDPPAKPVTADDATATRQRLEKALRAAEHRLGQADAGKPTQDLQKATLRDFDQLIKIMQASPNPDQAQPPDQPPGDSPDKSDRPTSGA